MLKLLYINLIIDILTLVISFFMLLSTSVVYAVILVAVGLLGLVPIIVLINHVESIENLKIDFARLQSEVKRLKDSLSGFIRNSRKRCNRRAGSGWCKLLRRAGDRVRHRRGIWLW